MVLVWFWYGVRYGFGMVLVWFGYGCMVLGWFWYIVLVSRLMLMHGIGGCCAYAVGGMINPVNFPNCSGSFLDVFRKIVGRGCGLEAQSPMRPSGHINTGMVLVWFGIVLVWFWYGFGMVLVCFGMVLRWFCYGFAMFWYGGGMVLVCFGMVLVWCWYGLVWCWYVLAWCWYGFGTA